MSENDSTGYTRTFTVAALTVIMVLSVLALGFTGSAAAVDSQLDTDSLSDGEVLVSSNPAETDTNPAKHAIVIKVGSGLNGDVFGTDSSEINITYAGAGNDVTASGPSATVDYISASGGTENLGGSVNDNGNNVRITGISGATTSDLTLSSGDLIKVTLDSINNGNFNAGDVEVAVSTDKDATDTATFSNAETTFSGSSVAVPLENDAGIEVSQGSSTTNYTSFAQAINNLNDNDATVQFTSAASSSTINELYTQPVAPGSLATATVPNSDNTITINSEDSLSGDARPLVVSDGGGGSTILDTTSHTLTVNEVRFDGDVTVEGNDPTGNSPASTAINVDPASSNTIDTVEIDNLGGNVLNVGTLTNTLTIQDSQFLADQSAFSIGDMGSSGDLDLTNNEIHSDTNNAVILDASDSAATVDIDGDTYNVNGTTTAIDLTATGAAPGSSSIGADTVSIDNVDVEGDSSGSVTAVDLTDFDTSATKANVDINATSSSTFNNVETGVDLTGLKDDADGGSATEQEVTVVGVTIDGDDSQSSPAIDLGTAQDASTGSSQDITLGVDGVTIQNFDSPGIDIGSDLGSGELTDDSSNGGSLTFNLNSETPGSSKTTTFSSVSGPAIKSEIADLQGAGGAGDTTVTLPDTYDGSNLEFNGVNNALSISDAGDFNDFGFSTLSVDNFDGGNPITLNTGGGKAIDIGTSGLSSTDGLNVSETEFDGAGDGTAIEFGDTSAELTLNYNDDAAIEYNNLATAVDIAGANNLDDGASNDGIIKDIDFEDVSGTAINVQSGVSLASSPLTLENIAVTGDSGTGVDIGSDSVGLTISTDDVEFGSATTPSTDNVTTGITFSAGSPNALTLGGTVDIGLEDTAGGTGIDYTDNGAGGGNFDLNAAPVINGTEVFSAGGSGTTGIAVATDGTFNINDGVDKNIDIQGVDNGLDIQRATLDATSFDSRELEGMSFTNMGDGNAVNLATSDTFSGVGDQNNEKALVLLDLTVESATQGTTGVRIDDASTGLVVVDSTLGTSNTQVDTGVDVQDVGGVLSGSTGASVAAGTDITIDGGSGIVAADGSQNVEISQEIPVTVSNADRFDTTTTPTITGSTNAGIGIDVLSGTFDFNSLESSVSIDSVGTGIKFTSSGDLTGALQDVSFTNIGAVGVDVDSIGSSLTVDSVTIESNDSPIAGIDHDAATGLTARNLDIGTGAGNGVASGIDFDTTGSQDLVLQQGNTINLTNTGSATAINYQDGGNLDLNDQGGTQFSLDVTGTGGGNGLVVDDSSAAVDFIGGDEFNGNFTVDDVDQGVVIANADDLTRNGNDEIVGLELTNIDSTGFSIESSGTSLGTGSGIKVANATITLDSGATGINHGGQNTDITIANASINSSSGSQLSGAIGINLDDGSNSITATLDDSSITTDETVISDVGTGLNVVDVGTLTLGDSSLSSNTEFENIPDDGIAIDIADSDSAGVGTIDYIDVNSSGTATGLQYDDSGGLTVSDVNFNEVGSGIDLANDGPGSSTSSLTVSNVVVSGSSVAGTGINANGTLGGNFDVTGDVTIDHVNNGIILDSGTVGSSSNIGTSNNVDINAAQTGIEVSTDPGANDLTIGSNVGVNGTSAGDSPTAIRYDDTNQDITVQGADLGTGTTPVFEGVVIASASGSPTVNSGTTIQLNDSSSAVGIDATGTGISGTFTVDNVDISGDSSAQDGTAIDSSIGSAGTATLFDSNSTTITDVGAGVVIDNAGDVKSSSNDDELTGVSFDGVSGTAINVTDPAFGSVSDLTIANMDISNGASTTVADYDSGSADVGVKNTTFDSNGVTSYVIVENTGADVDVKQQSSASDSTLTLNGGVGVDVSGASGTVTISGIDTITGDSSTTALTLSGSGVSAISDLQTIKNVDTGLDHSLSTTSDDDLTFTDLEVKEFHSQGINVNSGSLSGEVNLQNATLRAASGAGDTTALTVNGKADDTDVKVTYSNLTGDDAGTAIDLVSIDGSDSTEAHNIRFNNIESFDTALGGSSVTDLQEEDAIANYYGSSGGPNAADGANVSIDDADLRTAATAAIYDPYLTASVGTVENEVGTSDNLQIGDGIQSFGQDLTVQQDGQSFAVPTQIEDLETAAVQEPSSGYAIYEYNTTAGEYQVVDESTEESNFEAYAVALEDQSESLTFNLDYNNTVNRPGQIEYEQGFNLVPVTSATGGVTSSGTTDAATFDLVEDGSSNPPDTVELLGDDPAAGSIYTHDTFTTHDADNMDDVNPNVSPYNAVWVNVESGSNTIGARNTGPTGPAVTIDDIVNNGNLENDGNAPA